MSQINPTLAHPQPPETPAMPAMSLKEEFDQYRSELQSLQMRAQEVAQTSTDPAINRSLSEIGQTLTDLNAFVPAQESSPSIYVMADRASTLIERVRVQCGQHHVN